MCNLREFCKPGEFNLLNMVKAFKKKTKKTPAHSNEALVIVLGEELINGKDEATAHH